MCAWRVPPKKISPAEEAPNAPCPVISAGSSGRAKKQQTRKRTNPMNPNLSLKTAFVLLALPVAAVAQTTTQSLTPAPVTTAPAIDPNPADWGAHAGSQEFTIGGNGSSNRDLNSSEGGIALSYGYFFTGNIEASIRQTLDYSNPQGPGGDVWEGDTAFAGDFFLIDQGQLRPFVGANLGYVYGSNIRSSFDAGLEGGLRYYVSPRTFIYAMADYGWLFRHDKAIAARFSTGIWNWGVGMGFNF
jgi:hypothetical protein